MRLQFSIAIELDREAGGTIVMNDWSDYALGKLKQKEEDRRLQDRAFLEKQRVKKAIGAPLWQEVRRIAKENSEHLNAKAEKAILILDITDDTRLSVRSSLDPSRTLQATFYDEVGTLSWKCGAREGNWQLAVEGDGTVMFRWGTVPTNPASMVKQMMD